jgi:uncharacterized protein YidB (DUF937 family)
MIMGLLDVINGMQNGPRGQQTPAPSGGGGMSPITMALLGLVAYKAIKSFGAGQPASAPGTAPPAGSTTPPLGGLLGGLLSGAGAGSVLSGGLNDLFRQFQQGGQGDVAQSWIGTGPDKAIAPGDLANVLGEDRIKTLMAQSGMSRDELIAGLSQQLPELIDRLTPQGRIPTEHEASRLL